MLYRVASISIATIALIFTGCDAGSGKTYSNWPELGISIDKIGLSKDKIADCCFRGYVRSIQVGNFDDDSELEIAVVPQTSVYLFSLETLKQKEKIEYTKPDGDTLWFGLTPYLVSNKKGFSIAMRGGGFGEVGLLNKSGEKLWTFKPESISAPNGMVVDDSVSEEPLFYVSGKEAIYKLNKNGEVIWKVSEESAHIALIDDRDKENKRIVTAEYDSSVLSIWSENGELINNINLPFKQTGFDFVSNGAISGFVIKSGRKLAFIDREGKHRFTHTYINVPVYHGPSAALVRFETNQPPVLVVRSTSRSATGKSVLSVFTLDGTHLYEENLSGGPAIGVIPVQNQNRDRLVIGDGPKILWVYEKASPKK